MAPAPDRWWTVAEQVRTAIVSGYDTAGVELPDRRVITFGPPAADCEMLAVQLERVYGIGGDPTVAVLESKAPAAGFAMRGATFAVWLLRCIPDVDLALDQLVLPSVTDEEAAAAVIFTDAQLLSNVLAAAVKAGGLPGCASVAIEDWQNIEPQGGLGGGVLRLRVGTA